MAESSLAASWDELRQRVAFDRGYSPDPTAWTPEQLTILEMVLRSGARLFYKPRPIGGAPHEWSFLKPPFQLILPSGEQDVDLPADFAFLVGSLYFIDDSVSRATPLEQKNIAMIQKLRQGSPDSQSQPQFCAVASSSGPSVLKGQRFMLMLWPKPEQNYTVAGRYSVLPEALDTTRPYPYGGAAHAETLIQACLAASEQLNGTPGPHSADFAAALAASIEYDRRVQAQSIDNVDGFYRRRDRDCDLSNYSTYNDLYSA
jgi:hypothetical protein